MACAKRRRRVVRTFIVLGIIFIIFGLVFFAGVEDGEGAGWVFGGIIFLLLGVVSFIPPITVRLAKPPKKENFMDVNRYARQIEYDKAVTEFVNHVMAINEKFWKSLNQSQLEKGLYHLFIKAGYKPYPEKEPSLSKFQLLLYRNGKKTAVYCSAAKSAATGIMLGNVVSAASKNSGLSAVIYIALGGISLAINDNIFNEALRRGYTLSVWDVKGVLNLAESVDSLISDEIELDVLTRFHDTESEFDVVYLDEDPVAAIDLKVGRCVSHKSLGMGIVDEIGDGRHEITVSFSDDTGSVFRKKFKYPDSFDDGTLSYL